MQPTRVTCAGLAFLLTNLIGFVISITNDLPSCAQGCTAGKVSVYQLLTTGNGTGLEPPWFIPPIFIVALVINLRRDRWGLVGTLLAFGHAGLYLVGQYNEPITASTFRPSSFNFGLALFLALAFMAAAAVLVTATYEVVARLRHGWRRLPAGAADHSADAVSSRARDGLEEARSSRP